MRYWVYLNGEVPGSYEPEELAAIPGFGEAALVCPATSDLAERRWERAGVFPDINEALRAQERAPLAPLTAPPATRAEDPVRPLTPDDVLNDSSQRIFRHVTELMKELENRREERALTQSLQRRVKELTDELNALRERATYLQGRSDLIPGFQDRERELQEALARARADLHETRGGAERLDADLAKTAADLLNARRHLEEARAESAEREKHLGLLSKRLSEKEASLAKAFGVIRRLEETLGELLPGAVAGISRRVPVQAPAEAPPPPVRAEPEPQPVPAAAPAPEPPVAAVEEPAAAEAEGLVSLADVPSEPAAPEPSPADRHPTPPPYSVDRPPSGSRSIPAEGEVTPVPPPWQEKLGELFASFKKRFSR
jgi:hypothetical protein